MGLPERQRLYSELEEHRGQPLIVYVTSDRNGAQGVMSSDAISEIHLQLEALPCSASSLDLLIVSNGGDPTVAWRIVSLIRERVGKFNILVPQAAYSSATLIALGANQIVMHPNGNLGPTDPQVTAPKRAFPDGSSGNIQFGSEDLIAFMRFAREDVGLTDQSHLAAAFGKFSDAVGAIPIGVAARSAQLSVSMGEKLLQLHMTSETERQKARTIAETLTKDFFHHGYPVSRSEAKGLGLPIADEDLKSEALMWKIWLDVVEDLQVRAPFLPLKVLRAAKEAEPLFAPIPQVQFPSNLSEQQMAQVVQNVLSQVAVSMVSPVPYETVHAIIESSRLASRYTTKGSLLATRMPDLQIRVVKTQEDQGWKDCGKKNTAKSRKR